MKWFCKGLSSMICLQREMLRSHAWMYVHVQRDTFSYDEYGHIRYEKKNDHHVYHDVTTVALPSECSAISSETLL